MPAPTLKRPHELPDAHKGSGPTSILRPSKYTRREVGGYGRGRGRPPATRRDDLWWYKPQAGDLPPSVNPALPAEPPAVQGATQDPSPADVADASVASDTSNLVAQAAVLHLEQ